MKDFKKIAPELSKIKKEKPFGVPDDYFDDFSARLQMKLGEDETSEKSRNSKIMGMIKPVLGLAASFVLVVLLVRVPLKSFMSKEQPEEIAVVVDSYETEFQDMLEHMDESVFFGLLNSGESPDTLSDADLLAYVNTNFSSYEIYEYTEK